MVRHLVWYPDRSPAGPVVRALPDGFEAHPFSESATLRRRADDPEAIVVDLDHDTPDVVETLGGKLGGAPVIALVNPVERADHWPKTCYAYLPKPVTPFVLAHTLENAFEHGRLVGEAEQIKSQLEELNQIGVRLSAERDTDALLALILTKSREITHSDAGSIYLVEDTPDGGRRLRFKLTQNDFVTLPFTEFTMPISQASMAGHAALTGEVLNIPDVYSLPPGAPYRHNPAFDQQAGYRTRSMLVVPMRTPAGETIGVLQLINCKRDGTRRFPSVEAIEREAIPYPTQFTNMAASLASQAAVALQNSRLLENIQALFEGFVRASVTAIESRDPTTSGHSFRVADLTVALATAADRSDHAPFRDLRFSAEEMREIRYASLLHDFGKVGVREEVLVKAKKFFPNHLELVKQRAELIKRGVQLRYSRRKIDLLLRDGREQALQQIGEFDAELEAALAELDDHLRAVLAANEPTVMPQDVAAHIHDLPLLEYEDHLGERHAVITADEAKMLSIPRGSLTPEEFKQIQSHVVHTFQFLVQIPWTKELRRIPEIARSHHEKLNGSGYPEGFRAEQIPVQARMMTISDIFDALTARDRPYKAAVPVDRALDIINYERNAGLIDSDLFDLFLSAKPWEKMQG